jgi:chromosomal replication initiator protein
MMDQKLEQLWAAILEMVATLVSNSSFQTWIAPTRLVSCDGVHLVVEGPNPFFVDYLHDHHKDKLEYAARHILGERATIEFVSRRPQPRNTSPAVEAARDLVVTETVEPQKDLHLNGRYTFDEFVVGGGNRLAHAAAFAVASKPARAYNPLFIYGGVGLGKTHLIQAIGHHIADRHPKMRVCYVSSEQFTNDLIRAIRTGSTHDFKRRYREETDVLLIDDIHFIAGKETTQEEFFHTFNVLHNAGKQIVVTSDRSPNDLLTLEERLVSRFVSGLIADIQPPDLETRIAILRKRIEKEGVEIPDEVVQLIAESVKSNIRELEGAYIRILACSSLTSSEINVDMAREILKDVVSAPSRKKVTITLIQKTVAQHFDIPLESLRAKTRIARVVLVRQVSIYLARKLTDLPLAEIGKRTGGRDHSTVLYACGKIEKLLERDPALKRKVQTIVGELQS